MRRRVQIKHEIMSFITIFHLNSRMYLHSFPGAIDRLLFSSLTVNSRKSGFEYAKSDDLTSQMVEFTKDGRIYRRRSNLQKKVQN